jgi:hypothetical protein
VIGGEGCIELVVRAGEAHPQLLPSGAGAEPLCSLNSLLTSIVWDALDETSFRKAQKCIVPELNIQASIVAHYFP